MKKETLEKRMYGLVNYQLSGIQQGIQYGHAVVEYGLKQLNDGPSDQYLDWATNWKTFIILNGGTTNSLQTQEFSLQSHVEKLKGFGIEFATFNEPDLNNALTSVVFILDERVFNEKKYMTYDEYSTMGCETYDDYMDEIFPGLKLDEIQHIFKIREWIKGFRLA